ncbi:MAG: peptide/nickel transport system substrate-binding protein [Candidatus Magnetoglobus multicellularis str. Araruama]|uniref:Peptide/nickel transport system substrate-binding protein n=1 Tax=Candidatus Magnetoglobus multicellularis str. Araruama TaxID=890399 RepID=A0A1V1PFL4_9BACT|nr:MAG: peptide/nickel transport system substrate-binding protein [Candidatus Magnetoglobus multicellularis str. Araruama]
MTIRPNVWFHNGQPLTAEDVIYSFKRNMIVDPVSGPMWMLLEALTGNRSTRNNDGTINKQVIAQIDKAITCQNNTVVFHLPVPYPPFLALLTQAFSVVISRSWAIENHCWNGNIKQVHKFNNPQPGTEPLHHIANGTGAYRFKQWDPANQFIFERFNKYWGPQPYFQTAIIKCIKEWSARKLILQNGDAHRVSVDAPYYRDVRQMAHVKISRVPQLSVSCAFFCQNVKSKDNTGSGKLDGNGIPHNFFSDIHARKAFMHLFDRQSYGKEVFDGNAIIPSSPIIDGLSYQTNVPIYPYNLDMALTHLKKAWNGRVWKMGLYMVLAHNTGNEMREIAAHMLAENLMKICPKCRVDVIQVDWKDYLLGYRSFKYPIFITGWVADFPDPHNFVFPFMHSSGTYGRLMGLSNSSIDQLCDEGILTTDSDRRKSIYEKLQHLWYEKAFGLILYQQVNLRVYRDTVEGYVLNPMLTDGWENLKLLHNRKGELGSDLDY